VHVPSHELDFQRHMSWSVLCSVRWEVIVHFVDIGGIVDHHCLNLLFINYYNLHKEHFIYIFYINLHCITISLVRKTQLTKAINIHLVGKTTKLSNKVQNSIWNLKNKYQDRNVLKSSLASHWFLYWNRIKMIFLLFPQFSM